MAKALSSWWTQVKTGWTLADKKKLFGCAIGGTAVGGGLCLGATIFDCETLVYDAMVLPVLHSFQPETAQRMVINAAKWGFCPKDTSGDIGRMENAMGMGLWDIVFSGPIGISAGFDTDAECFPTLFHLGVSHVEIGTVTPRPQKGNEAPRDFLLPEDDAVIQRYGQPSEGLAAVKDRLKKQMAKLEGGVVGVNIGANTDSEDPVADFVKGIEELGPEADYLVVNLAAWDVPALQALSKGEQLHAVLKASRKARDALTSEWVPPLLVKISTDLTQREQFDVALAVVNYGIDGIIVDGGTLTRPSTIVSDHRKEAGLLYGKPGAEASTACIGNMYRFTRGEIPIIAAGGIMTSLEAYTKIRAGACMVQLNSALKLKGPGVVPRMRRNLWKRVREDGYSNVTDCIGVDTKILFEEQSKPKRFWFF